MIKEKELEAANRGAGCLGRSQSDEPVFILVARDQLAANIVREWARTAKLYGVPKEKVTEAMEVAQKMDQWRIEHGGGKLPD